MSVKEKKILIVSASIGAGHHQAAQAIEKAFQLHDPFVQIDIVDFMAGESSFLNALVKKAYLQMLKLSPEVYDLLYHWTRRPSQGAKAQHLLAIFMQRTMERLLEQHQPDVLICTHPFPCGAASYLRRIGKVSIPIVAVITDFTVHRLWVYPEVDQYFVAGRELQAELRTQGIAASRIFASGIPIDPAFSRPFDRESIKAGLGFDERPVLLIMGGGLGLGAMREVLIECGQIGRPLQFIMVAGRNKALLNDLASVSLHERHSLQVLGYTEQIPQLMAVTDLLLTKPGALTISEALAMKLPILFYAALPGQEEDNAAYIAGHGAAIWEKDSAKIREQVSELLAQPDAITRMRANADRIRRPEAALHVACPVGKLLAPFVRAGV